MITKILIVLVSLWGAFLLRWGCIWTMKRFFPKKWTYLKARNRYKFSNTIKLSNYADKKRWSKDYVSKWDKIKQFFTNLL